MARYRVPLYMELYREVVVEAETEQEAILQARQSDAPVIAVPEGVTSGNNWNLDDEPEKLD